MELIFSLLKLSIRAECFLLYSPAGYLCIFLMLYVKDIGYHNIRECGKVFNVTTVSKKTRDSTALSRPRSAKNPCFLILLPLFLLIVAGFCFPPPAEAFWQREKSSSSPAYLQQLENYRKEVLEYQKEQERIRRETALQNALIQHTVKRGDTLSSIAREYGTEISSLIYWNDITNPHLIHVGQVFDILTIEGTLHRVEEGDTLQTIARRYKVDSNAIAFFNLLEKQDELSAGQKVIVPGGEVPGEQAYEVNRILLASRGGERASSGNSTAGASAPTFRWPLQGRITSYYGWRNGSFHFGLDIAAPYGKEIKAAAGGTVDFTGYRGNYGLTVVIDHGRGWSSLYAHSSRALVTTGEQVATGQPVAAVGSSGNATGPHVHLEIIKDGERLNPLDYLP